jgi:hypothetical protein
MRYAWDEGCEYESFGKACAGIRRDIARGYLLSDPQPQVYEFGKDDFLVTGMFAVHTWGTWFNVTGKEKHYEHLQGEPLPLPKRPKSLVNSKGLKIKSQWKKNRRHGGYYFLKKSKLGAKKLPKRERHGLGAL